MANFWKNHSPNVISRQIIHWMHTLTATNKNNLRFRVKIASEREAWKAATCDLRRKFSAPESRCSEILDKMEKRLPKLDFTGLKRWRRWLRFQRLDGRGSTSTRWRRLRSRAGCARVGVEMGNWIFFGRRRRRFSRWGIFSF